MRDDPEEILVELIRKWYPTICYELDLPMPTIRIKATQDSSPYGHRITLGMYDPMDRSVTMYVLPPAIFKRVRGQYLLTLAHELRHAWQHRYGVAPTEGDANDWARMDFIKRYGNGPTAGRYGGPIIGAKYPCRACHKPIRLGMYCVECQKWEAELARSRPSLPMNVRNLLLSVRDVKTTIKKKLWERKLRRYEARKKEVFEYKLQAIDHHPNNGTYGWWAIDGRYYVQAKTAAEAVMKVADDLGTETPEIVFFGDEMPFRLKGSQAISKR